MNVKIVCVILFAAGVALAEDTNEDDSVFNIGNLLPDLHEESYESNGTFFGMSSDKKLVCRDKLTSVLYAIKFASEKLREMFRESYRCNFNLNPASTKCDVSYGTRSFFELAKDVRRTLAVFGGSCDSTFKPIAESVQFFNLTILSYTETDPAFSDPVKYNGFFRLVPSEEQHNHLQIHLIKQHNWTRVGTIYQTKAKYTLAHNSLIRELDKIANQTVSRSILENQTVDQYESILKDFQSNDIKIIIGIFDVSTTLRLFCEIYKRHMYGENYQWIILGSYNDELLDDYYDENIQCTIEQLHIALNGTLQTRVVEYSYEYEKKLNAIVDNTAHKTHAKKSDITRIDHKYAELVQAYMNNFVQLFNKKNQSKKPACTYSYFHGYAFDVLLTIFKVFSNLIENDKFTCQNSTFVRDINWFNLVNSEFKKISFKGVTGNVSFSNGSRIGQIKLEQLIANYEKDDESGLKTTLRESLIYVHDQNYKKFHQINKIRWHGKNPPRDQTIKIKMLFKIPNSYFVCMAILATTGIFLAIAFLIFNIKFRKHKFIKMSSPYLNNLIIIGCLFSYISIYFLGEYEGLINKDLFKYICMIRIWLLAIGFTLAFGAMFSKTYRVHAILTNAKLTRKVIKDYKLYGIVVLILIVDVIILICWHVIDPIRTNYRHYQTNSEGEKLYVIENLVCESDYMKIWIGSLFGFKSLLILFGCFFAYETRHVSISALNDSQYIGISVYNVLIMCLTGAAIAFIVHDKTSAFVLISLFIFACTTITLCLVFLPKIIEVKKDPTGRKKQKPKNNFKKPHTKDNKSKLNDIGELDRKINQLIEDNKNKASIIDQITNKIESLIKQAKQKGRAYVDDCLKDLHIDDIELKKLIDKFLNDEKMNADNVPTSICPDTTVISAVNAVVNYVVKEPPLVSTEPVVEPNEKRHLLDHNDMEKKHERELLIVNDIIPEIVECVRKVENLDVYVNNLDSNHVMDQDSAGNLESNLVKRYSKRRFNPPPHIIDLNNLIADNLENTENFTFKMDI